MKIISTIRGTDSSIQDSRFNGNSEAPRGSSRSGIFAALFFAATLALAPAPAFAQHGGGGGGGSHGGGGGMGGGSHGGGSGGGHATSSAGSSAAHAPASSGNAGTGSATHTGTATSGTTTSGNTVPSGNPAPTRFAAGNNTWQEPPARGVHGATTMPTGTNVRGAVAAAPRAAVAHIPIVPRRPIGFSPFFPFYPGFYPGFGFGFGFGGGFYGAFGPCDPFWGCYGYGFNGGIGYGYYGGSFGSGYGADLNYSGAQDNGPSDDMAQSPDGMPSLLAAPETSVEQEAANPGPAAKPVTAVLYLKDGSSYAVTDYWLADGKIHYVTSYGGQNVIDQNALDLQRTVNENATQGLTFTLRPASNDTNPQQ